MMKVLTFIFINLLSFSRSYCQVVRREVAQAVPTKTQEYNNEDVGASYPYVEIVNDPSKISFKLSAKNVKVNDTLSLKFSINELVEVAIIKPDSTYMLVVSNKPVKDCKGPLMNKKTLLQNKKLTIIPFVTKAYPYASRYKENIPIIDIPGKYEIRVSDNLHTDLGYMEVSTFYFLGK